MGAELLRMKHKLLICLAGVLLLAAGYAVGHYLGRTDARRLMRDWFSGDGPDANLLTLHVKVRADGSPEMNYRPTDRREIRAEAIRRARSWGIEATWMRLWSDDGATFGQLTASAINPVGAAYLYHCELRFVRNAKSYRIKVWLPSSYKYMDYFGRGPTELRIAANGCVRSGHLTGDHTDSSALMESLRREGELGRIAANVDPATPMGFVFDVLAAAADRGLTQVSFIFDEERPETK